jgi:hypothetical protein
MGEVFGKMCSCSVNFCYTFGKILQSLKKIWKEQPWSHYTMSLLLCQIFAISVKLNFENFFWVKTCFLSV